MCINIYDISLVFFRNYYFKDCVLILVQRRGYNIYDRER